MQKVLTVDLVVAVVMVTILVAVAVVTPVVHVVTTIDMEVAVVALMYLGKIHMEE